MKSKPNQKAPPGPSRAGQWASERPAGGYGGKSLRPTSQRARWDGPHPALPYAELPAFMTRCEPIGIAARALEFAILSAVRTSEVSARRGTK
jgi:hypothetical protein